MGRRIFNEKRLIIVSCKEIYLYIIGHLLPVGHFLWLSLHFVTFFNSFNHLQPLWYLCTSIFTNINKKKKSITFWNLERRWVGKIMSCYARKILCFWCYQVSFIIPIDKKCPPIDTRHPYILRCYPSNTCRTSHVTRHCGIRNW